MSRNHLESVNATLLRRFGDAPIVRIGGALQDAIDIVGLYINGEQLKVYTVMYSSCVFESAYYTVSVHLTKRGAAAAMRRLRDAHFIDNWRGGYDRYIDHQGFRYGVLVVLP